MTTTMPGKRRFKAHVRGGIYANWTLTVVAEDHDAALAEAMRRIRRETPATVNIELVDETDALVISGTYEHQSPPATRRSAETTVDGSRTTPSNS